jgi:hypothetical protein
MADQTDEQRARGRFFVISAVRTFGIVMILLAITVAQGLVDLPDWTIWILAPLGLIEAFLMPVVLARMWRTQDQLPPRP